MGSLQEVDRNEVFPSALDAVTIKLNRLENQLRDKERELGAAQREIKTMKMIESLKDRALMELSHERKKLDEKLVTAEKHLESKNLKIKKLSNEKKEALAAQFAAEATLRRVQVSREDEEFLPIEAVVAPLESDIQMYKNEISILQEDKKAFQRLIKSKEAALIEAEKILRSALERVLIVEDVQNQNLELRRQIEICQDENKFLNKIQRQKVVEVEKLTQTIRELEESILAAGATANAVRDYQHQVSELNKEKRTLERELARVKVCVSRVATVVANEWKDENNRLMPVKQWLEERRCLQGGIQRLQDKLVVSERTAKVEAQLKDKLRLRLKTLEEGLKHASGFSNMQAKDSEQGTGFSSHNAGPRKHSISQTRTSLGPNKACILQQINLATEGAESTRKIKQANDLEEKYVTKEKLVRKNLSTPRSKSCDDKGKKNTELKVESSEHVDDNIPRETKVSGKIKTNTFGDDESQIKEGLEDGFKDIVSGFLYDRLQKEVIYLRKQLQEKDGLLDAKNNKVKMLLKKTDALTKAIEAESKKMKREAMLEKRKQYWINQRLINKKTEPQTSLKEL